jgi:uncharacterized protein YukE
MSIIGKVSAVFTANSSGLVSGVNQAARAMSRMESSVASLRSGMNTLVAIQGAQLFGSVASGAASAARAFLDLGRSAAAGISDAVEQATTLGEETSKSGVIFGESAARVMDFAKGADAIGLSTAAALQATGSFGNLFTAMGLGRDQAADYATTMTGLGADLASFNNATVEEAVQAIGAALRGEAEPIRRFGVLLDEATLKQEALARGLISSTSGSLTPAIKAQAAYAAILKQTTSAQGDFARTSGSLANLGRIVGAQASNLAGDAGSAFEPLFQAGMSAMSNILTEVRPFVSQVAASVRDTMDVIGAAIKSLGSQLASFLGGLNGTDIGKTIGDGIMAGARFLAGIGDYIITNFSSVFQYLSGVGAQWGAVADFMNRAANFMSGVFNAAQAGLGLIVLGFTGSFEALATIAQQIGKFLGFDTSTLDGVVAGAKAFNQEISNGITENLNAAQAGFSAAFAANADPVGQAVAGPLTTALDNAISRADASAAQIGESGKGAAAAAGQQIADAVALAAEPQALKAVDSRSSEGVAEMFRLMRGTGADVQERQLAVLEDIAATLDSQEQDTPFAIEGA